MSTILPHGTHGVALVRVYDAGLKRAARGSLKYRTQKNHEKFAIWAPSHNFVGLYLRKKHVSTIGKKHVKQQYLPTRPYNMVKFRLLTAGIVSLVWGTQANFNQRVSRIRVLAALLHGTLVVGVSQTLQR